MQDIKLFLKRFGSNIIYSNGLIDPYSQMRYEYSFLIYVNLIATRSIDDRSHV